MARNDPQMNLRVPMELKEKIEKAALDNGRTITAEAVYRLEQSFNELSKVSIDFDKKSAEVITQAVNDSITNILTSLSEQGIDDIKIITALKKNQKK